jgi:hypothetical protein
MRRIIYGKIDGSSLVTDMETSNVALYKFPCLVYFSTLKMEALCSSETLLSFYQIALLHMAEDKMLLRTVAEVRT